MSFKIHSTAPDAFVKFFCYEKDKTSNDMSLPMKIHELTVKKDIMSLSTSKSKSGAGSFEMTLGSAVNFKSYISPGSWCMIHMSNHKLSGEETSELNGGLKMIGIVRSVKRQELLDTASGKRMVRYTVSGDDFHSIFNSQIYVNQTLADPENTDSRIIATAVLGSLVAQNQMDPGKLIKGLIDAIIGTGAFEVDPQTNKSVQPSQKFRVGLPIKIPSELFKSIRGRSGSIFSDMVIRHVQNNLLGKTQWLANIGEQVSLWSLIQTYSNSILNECYTEILPFHDGKSARLVPSFVMRAIPFSSQRFDNSQIMFSKHNTKLLSDKKKKKEREAQETHQDPDTGKSYYISRQIFENEIMALSTGRSDSERFNFFYVTPHILGDSKTDNAFFISQFSMKDISDKTSQERYGLKPFISATQYATTDPASQALLMTNICKDIWENAYLYENGSVQIPGVPNYIPVGTNITFAERGWIAHVENVSHSFGVGNEGHKQYRTSISFTRLQKTDGSPIDWSEGREANGQLGAWDRGISEDIKTVGGKKLTKRVE